jgi:hypothetical protein
LAIVNALEERDPRPAYGVERDGAMHGVLAEVHARSAHVAAGRLAGDRRRADDRILAVDGERGVVGVTAVEQRAFEELHAEHAW